MRNLLDSSLSDRVQPTELTRKLTIDGITKIYPVQRVALDLLYYNDQNDRISTWISQYENRGNGFNSSVGSEEYNAIVEDFVIQSNPASIEKTQLNIELVGQREPGVVLTDGRIIDGNRRFTCLRRLADKNEKFGWLEAVILDRSYSDSKKQIKMLELAIQHGEEKKVDYNPIDKLVGLYRDVIETGLLTIEEYAMTTNETLFEVRKKLQQAQIMVEFLEYIDAPKRYHIVRELQVFSTIEGLQDILRRLSSVETQEETKRAVFMNMAMRTNVGDGRKYIRGLSSMLSNGFFPVYLKEQAQLEDSFHEARQDKKIQGHKDLEVLSRENMELVEELEISMDKSLLKAKKKETRNRPSQIISKSISILKDVDTNIINKLNEEEKEKLQSQVERLGLITDRFDVMVGDVKSSRRTEKAEKEEEGIFPRYFIAPRRPEEPLIRCENLGEEITNLVFNLEFSVSEASKFQDNRVEYKFFFIDKNNETVSDEHVVILLAGNRTRIPFSLSAKMSKENMIYLALQSIRDERNELQELIPFVIDMAFIADFDF